MSFYTSTGLTVSPEYGEEFLRILAREPEDRPDEVRRTSDGSVTAVWKDRNHFDSSEMYDRISEFLDGISEDDYGMEIIDEDWDADRRGYYPLGFYASLEYHLDGSPVDLSSVSRNASPKRRAPARKQTKSPPRKPAARKAPAKRKATTKKPAAKRRTKGARR
ncbi:MAG: hypothetical protein IKP53_08265 [Candidatus Methanomethylophilaceae archaeon]|nr:hypothetical protein [Candidatus Methanomethylophilaceae archaeon]